MKNRGTVDRGFRRGIPSAEKWRLLASELRLGRREIHSPRPHTARDAISLIFSHSSNAGISSRNGGLGDLGIRYSRSF